MISLSCSLPITVYNIHHTATTQLVYIATCVANLRNIKLVISTITQHTATKNSLN